MPNFDCYPGCCVGEVDKEPTLRQADRQAQHLFCDVSNISEESCVPPFMDADWFELVQRIYARISIEDVEEMSAVVKS